MANINKESILTQEYVKEIFDYQDGFLYWKISRTVAIKVGQLAGGVSLHRSGPRCMVKIDGKTYYTARLIFLWHHGYLPEVVDHIDRNSINNKINNLRSATVIQNSRNRSSNKNTSSKYVGVSLNHITIVNKLKDGSCKSYSYVKWLAQISSANKRIRIGHFKTEKEAAIAFNIAAKLHYGEFTNLNIVED